jgi:ribosome-associated protein
VRPNAQTVSDPSDHLAVCRPQGILPLKMTEKTKELRTRKPEPESPQRKAAARQLAIELARMAADTRCTNVVVLDVSGLSPVTDFFVIATGTSNRQMHTVVTDIVEYAHANGHTSVATSGLDSTVVQWILADMIDVIFHVFSESARTFYDLETLYADASRVEWSSHRLAAPNPA